MLLKKIKDLLILAYNPPHFFLFLGILIYLISINEIKNVKIIEIIIFALINVPISGGLMSLNKFNDLKEDKIKGRNNPLINEKVSRKETLAFTLFLYSMSLLTALIYSIKTENILIIPFSFFSIITWWYSDKLYLGKLLGLRLKEHYLGEIFAYTTSFPLLIISIWLISNQINYTASITSMAFVFFGLSSLSIKDMKDISSDAKAEIMTIANKLSLEKLLKLIIFSLLIYYLIILTLISSGHFEKIFLLILIPFLMLLKPLISFSKKNWAVKKSDRGNIKLLYKSMYGSILLLTIAALISLI